MPEAARLYGFAARLAWRASPGLSATVLVLVALQALSPVGSLWLAKAVVDSIALAVGVDMPSSGPSTALTAATWIALAVIYFAAEQLVNPLASTLQSIAGDRITGWMNRELMQVTEGWHGVTHFENPLLADDLERARIFAAEGGLRTLVDGAQLLLAILSLVGLAMMLALLHPLVPVVVSLAAIPNMLSQRQYGEQTTRHLYMQVPESRKLMYWRQVLLNAEPAKDVRLYSLASFFRTKYEISFARTLGSLDSLRSRLSLVSSFTGSVSAAAVGATYVYVVWRTLEGIGTLGDLVLYGGALTLFHARLLAVGLSFGLLPMPLQFLSSFFRVLGMTSDLPLHCAPIRVPRPIRDGIVFSNVTFTYPGSNKPTLVGVSLTIRPDETLALVGRNGAGKSTLIKLLLRLYDPDEGSISLDGTDLRHYDLHDLRDQMGVIFQDYVQYELTVGENIGIANPSGLHDRERLLRAARDGGAVSVLETLPEGLDARLGREFGGRELSGGEWQKLALSRAFFRKGQLLILDEPTASLDVETEYEIYTRFRKLTHGKTTVLISHRFATVRMADRIVYLEGGQVREEGSHDELMLLRGQYASLYRLQESQYVAQER